MDDLELAISAAQAGAAIVRGYFGESLGSQSKGRNNPVTIADEESEAAILELLGRERPSDTLFAEESGVAGDGDGGRRWIVDPLDGTVNFVHGIPEVSVSIALYEEDAPVVGVVVDVLRNEVFSAMSGRGAHLNGDPIRVSKTSGVNESVISTGFPYDHHEYPEAYTATVAGMLAHVNGIRRCGSAALDLAWVAAGRYEAHWEYFLAPWDIAAGTLLVREAGGRVTDSRGRDLVPEDPMILASNGLLHDTYLAIIGETLPPHVAAAERPT